MVVFKCTKQNNKKETPSVGGNPYGADDAAVLTDKLYHFRPLMSNMRVFCTQNHEG